MPAEALMERPKRYDALTLKRAMELAMPKVRAYLGNDWIESERPHVEKQIIAALSTRGDGYSMARELERRYYWEEDRGLVDLTDEVDSCLSAAHRELRSQWIRAYGISPTRSVGDKVMTSVRKGEVGTIIRINDHEASYAVRYADQPETSCYVVEYENVTEVQDNGSGSDTVQN